MKNYYIQINKNLLEPKHVKAMGSALWEYAWCLDRVTRIVNGAGVVLGGKPVKLVEIAEVLGRRREAISYNLKKLENAGYISVTTAPYGLVIRVNKAQKWFAVNRESQVSSKPLTSLKKPRTYVVASHKRNKENTVDNTDDNNNTSVLSVDASYETISKLYYEVIDALDVPVVNHNTIRQKIKYMSKNDDVKKITGYLLFMRDKYKLLTWEYKPQINNALDIYSKRVAIENTIKQSIEAKNKKGKIGTA